MSQGLSRRDFVRSAAAGAAGLLVASCGEDGRRAGGGRSRPAVIVLGAGLAGLAAAIRLKEAGASVEILEARDRVGGRVETLRDGFRRDWVVDAGATWVPRGHLTTRFWLERYRIALAPQFDPDQGARLAYRYHLRGRQIDYFADGSRRITADGVPADFPFALDSAEADRSPAELASTLVYEAALDLADEFEGDWSNPAAMGLDDISFGEWLRRRGASADAIALLSLGLFEDWGDGVESVSALCVLRDAASFDSPSPEDDYVPGGMDQLPRAMARELEGSIRFGRRVTKVRIDSSGVEVTTANADGESRHRADRVVCALPLPILREIEFEPALTEATRAAIRELPTTSVFRSFIELGGRPWAEAGLFGDSLNDLGLRSIQEASRGRPGTAGLLSTYTAGTDARRLAKLSDRERAESVLRDGETVFPGLRAVFEGIRYKDWDADPQARGAFTWYRPGQMRRHGAAFGSVHPRLEFAGEHASTVPGWMTGALESGEEAARATLIAHERQTG